MTKCTHFPIKYYVEKLNGKRYLRSHDCKESLYAVVFIFIVSVNAQQVTPPLEIPLKLSGTFGEFRATHFHAGLDIKTQGQEV